MSTPKPTGLPVSSATRVRPSVAASDTYSKCGVLAAHDHAERDHGIRSRLERRLRDDRQLEAAGHLHTSVTSAPDAASTRVRAGEQAVRDRLVPEAGDDRDLAGRCRRSSSSVGLPSPLMRFLRCHGGDGARSSASWAGSAWPIRSRLASR